MGFDINSASHKPVIRETASAQDGGGGNLGYFEQGEHKEKKHKEDSIFAHEEEKDRFVKESDKNLLDEGFSISKLIAEIIFSIREWFKKLLG